MPFKEQIGQKKVEFVVEENVLQKNDYSEEVPAWVPRFHLRGVLKKITGSEKLEAMSVQSDQTHRLYARWRDNIFSTSHRLVRDKKIYSILDIDNVNQMNRKMIMILKEENLVES